MDDQTFRLADVRRLGVRLATVAGGMVMVAGTLLPWLKIHYPVPVGHLARTGPQMSSGRICLTAGVLVVVAAVVLAIVPAARQTALLAMAASTGARC